MKTRIAIPTWDDRISPVFDVARHLLVVDVEDNAEVARSEVVIEETALPRRAKQLTDLGVNVLICGAMSRPLERMLTSAGVQVIPHTCGSADSVLKTFLSGQLTEQAFLMPGCRGRGRGRGRRLHGRLGEGPGRKRRGFGPGKAK